MSFDKKIGNRIRTARLESNMTQEEFAQLLNISRVSMVNIEKGRQACSIKRIITISKLTGFSTQTLIDVGGNDLPELKGFDLSYEIHKEIDAIDESHLKSFIKFYKSIK